jgi:transcriptional regulator with XRE-family HTH domain
LTAALELARELIRARTEAKLTQTQVARRMGILQSAVTRMERGRSLPSMTSLRSYAKSVGCRIEIKFVPITAPKMR